MEMNKFYKWLSIVSISFGAVLIVGTQTPLAGFAINNVTTLTANSTILWGAFFITTGAGLFYLQRKNS